MKQILFAVAFALFAMPVSAEQTYSPAFYREMQKLGLEREAFLYALQWAANEDPQAEISVANALLDGLGVDPDPVAAITFVCGSRSIDETEVRKLLIRVNLRVIGTYAERLTCD